MDRIVGAIAGRDPLPDVLALQEVEDRSLRAGLRGHQLDRFVARLVDVTGHRWQGRHWCAHRYRAGVPVYGQGQALVWRGDVELIDAERCDITHVRLPSFARLKQRRIAVHARLQVRGRAMDLVQAHLSLPAFFESGDPPPGTRRMGFGSNQLREVENLLGWLQGRLAPTTPAVLVGDLNSQPGTAVTERLVAAGWSDGFRQGAGLSLAEQQAQGTHAFLGTPMHIDHVFVRGGASFRPTMMHRLGEGPFRGLSDHTPKEGAVHGL